MKTFFLYGLHALGDKKVVITYRHLWREEWTELRVTHCIRLRFSFTGEKISCGLVVGLLFLTVEKDQR